MNELDAKEIREKLVDANGELGQAIVELQYARKNQLLDRNIEEIDEMIGSAKFLLDTVQREIDEIREEEQEKQEEQEWKQWNTGAQFIKALEAR